MFVSAQDHFLDELVQQSFSFASESPNQLEVLRLRTETNRLSKTYTHLLLQTLERAMCKFTNRLFVFTLLALLALGTLMAPVDAAAMRAQHRSAADPKFLDLLSLNEDNNNYDLHYDQRQKGEENLHVRMNGFFIEMPDDDDKDASDELKELLYYAILFGGSEEMFKHLIENKISTTPTPASLTLTEFGLLNENKLDAQRHATGQQIEDKEAATKHKVEGRNANPLQGSGLVAVNPGPESKRVGLITKEHFNTLLSLLKRMRRN